MLVRFTQTVLFLLLVTVGNAQISQNMNLLGNWNPGGFPTAGSLMYNDIWGYVDCSGNEYAIMGGAAYYHFIDITNPSNPTEVTSILGGNTTTWRDMKTYSSYAYGVCDSCNEGLAVFDLSDLPNSVSMVGQYTTSFSRAHNIYIDVDNGRLYAVGTDTQSGGAIVFDLAANPANPPEIGRMSLPGGYMHDIFVRNNIGYGNSGNNGLWVYDFSNLNNVTTLGNITSYPQQGYNHAGWVTDDNTGYVLADETHDRSLKYLDVSNLSNITATSTFRSELLAPDVTGSIAHNPFIRDNYAIVSYYHDGLQVFDISDPSNVVQTAWYDTYTNHSNYSGFDGNWGAYPFLPSGNILASDEFTGLYILQATNITFTPITTPPPPTISIFANGDTDFCEGGSVDLNAVYSGFSVQWYKDGVLIPDANSDIYTATEAGFYHATTANSACSESSSDIEITIIEAPNATLNVPPFNQICDNESFQITAPAGETSYTWTRNGNVLPQNSNSITVNQAGDYQVEVSNGSCSTLSIIANLTVETTPDATLNINEDQEICEDQTVNLSVAAGADTYQWLKDNSPFAGNTNLITVSESGDYRVIVTNGNCTDNSATVTVTSIAYPDMTLNNNGPIQLCNGESDILTIPPGAENYIWYKNNNEVVGTTNIINIFESGTYFVEASNGNCTDFSQTVIVDVGEDPDVTLNVPNQNMLCDGEILEIAVPAGASNYTWYYNNVAQNGETNPNYFATNSGDYYVIADINGCTSTSETVNIALESYPDASLNVANFNEICEGEELTISAPSGAEDYQWFRNNILFSDSGNTISVNEPGDYYLVVSNGNCESISNTTTLVVQASPDVTLNTTGTVEVCQGEMITLSVPSGAQTYTWMRNGSENVGSESFIDVSLSGTYQVVASNGNCENTSQTVTVNVQQYPNTEVNVPLQNEICDGDNINISVAAGADSYEWFLNGNSVGNTTNAITATEAGNYQVVAANGGCESTSEMVNLTVNSTPSVEMNVPNFNQICEGEEVTLMIPAGASNYSWFQNGNPISNTTNSITVTDAGMYAVMASNGSCEATSEMIEIAVNAYPETTLNIPLQNEICAGETVEISVPAGAANYQWYQNGDLLSQNSNSITISVSGDYQVVASNGSCESTSEIANVQVTAYPNVALSMPLQNQICEGENLPISVAMGAENYQWFLNGNAIANTAGITATEAGNYTVTASNGSCEATSETLNLTILAYPSADLAGETTNDICQGETVEIGVSTGAQSYEWYQNGNLLPENGNTITASTSGDYQVVVANGNCAVTSEMVNVQVFDYPSATISVPTENNLCEGETLTISIPSGAQDYEWYQDGELLDESTENITASQSGSYYAVALNGDCATTSETVQLNITALPNVDLSVGSMNQICIGDQLTIEAAGGANSYQWYQNGALLPISGNALTVAEAGEYQLIAANGNCSATSEMVTVEVVDAPDSELNVDTENEICAGENLLLEAVGGANNYQWFLNGEATGNNENTLLATEAGEYFVMIGSGDCSAISETINLTVNELPSTNLNVASENTICVGESLEIAVPAGANNYVWYFNDIILIEDVSSINVSQSGSYYVVANNGNCESISQTVTVTTMQPPNTSLTVGSNNQICEGEIFTVSAPEAEGSFQWFLDGELVNDGDEIFTTSEAGTYYLEVTNGSCTATSQPFNLAVTPLPNPQLAQAGEQSICEGEGFNMTVATDADSFEWYQNGTPLGNNGTFFTVSEPGEYYVLAETNGCEGTSESVFLSVNEFPSADIQTTAVQICPNETAMLSTPSVGESYQWFFDFQPISGANATTLEVSEAGIYFISVTNNGCTSVSVNVEISVFLPMTPEITFDGEKLTATPADAYQWFLNGNPILGATDQSYNPTINGDYSVQIIDDNGCETSSEPLNIIIDGVQDVELANSFILYPNPVQATLFLENKSEDLKNSRVLIYNNIGQVIFEKQFDFGNNTREGIAVGEWAAGVYFIKMETENGRFFVRKFVKE